MAPLARLQWCLGPILCTHFQKIYPRAILEGCTGLGQQGTYGSAPSLFAILSLYVLSKNVSTSPAEWVTSL